MQPIPAPCLYLVIWFVEHTSMCGRPSKLLQMSHLFEDDELKSLPDCLLKHIHRISKKQAMLQNRFQQKCFPEAKMHEPKQNRSCLTVQHCFDKDIAQPPKLKINIKEVCLPWLYGWRLEANSLFCYTTLSASAMNDLDIMTCPSASACNYQYYYESLSTAGLQTK